MCPIFADIFIANVTKTGTDTPRLSLDRLLVMHEAGIIISPQMRCQITQKGSNIPSTVFHHHTVTLCSGNEANACSICCFLLSLSVEMKTSV